MTSSEENTGAHPRVQPGDVLDRKFRVERVLGEGGMGVVVAAMHLQLDQRVAIKFMLPAAFKSPEALARFTREARAAVRLRSEHVARVLDTGTFENGAPYIVMEYMEGADLAGELERSGPMSPQVAAEYIVQACDAIAEAHSIGIVHRDLKPANLFLTRRPDGTPLVKVLDFGISKASSPGDSALGMTKTAAVMGSPLYMSPEQLKSSKDVDPRTDVWSLGVILYELLGGRTPFRAETLGELLAAVLTESPPPLASARPGLPPDLCALVDRCLVRDRAERCQSVGEIARGLAPFCPARVLPVVERVSMILGENDAAGARAAISPHARTVGDAGSSTPKTTGGRTGDGWGGTLGPTDAVAPPARTRHVALWTVAGVLALAVGAAGVVGLRGHGKASAETPPPSAAALQGSAPIAASPAPLPPAAVTDLPTPPVQPPAPSATTSSAPVAAATWKGAVAHAPPASPARPPAAPAPPKPASTTTPKSDLLDTSN